MINLGWIGGFDFVKPHTEKTVIFKIEKVEEEMKVDLSKLEIGDTVHFRNKGIAVVSEIKEGDCEEFTYLIRLETFHAFASLEAWSFTSEGECGQGTEGECIFDIIRVEHKPFDWKDVKHGMAFVVHSYGHITLIPGNIVWYIGQNLEKEFSDCIICCSAKNSCANSLTSVNQGKLTRSPENDIK